MAREEVKGSKVLAVLKKDYPFERVLMGILGVLVIVFGIYIIDGVNNPLYIDGLPNPNAGWLIITNREGFFSFFFGTDTKILIFAAFIITLGVVSFAMAVWPFLKPSILEMKRVSWPNSKTIQNHSARVYGFILFLLGVFIVYTLALVPLFAWLRG